MERQLSTALVTGLAVTVAWLGAGCDPNGGSPRGEGGKPDASSDTGGAVGSGGSAAGSGGTAASGGTGSGGACGRVELLTSGNFDGDNSNWTQNSEKWPVVIVTAEMAGGAAKPQSGSTFGRLGGYPDMGQDNLLTSVEVPDSAIDMVFSFYSIVSTEETSAERHDLLYLALDSDTVYADSYIDNTNVHADWQRYEMAIDPAAAGKRLVLVMSAQNDGAKATTFLVDSFSLTARMCP